MTSVYVWWGISAAVLVTSAAWLGRTVKQNILGILLDNRGRYSLSQFQIVLWTLVVLSLLSGVFFARVFGGVATPLNITIPNELLIVMGISVGSAATASAIKASKDLKDARIRTKDLPKFSQLYLAEEGSGPETIDVTRFQNFWLTLIVIVAYVATAVAYIAAQGTPAEITALPPFDPTLLGLLGISHAGYLAGKLPDQK